MKRLMLGFVLLVGIANAQPTPTPFVPAPTPQPQQALLPHIHCKPADTAPALTWCCYEWRGSAYPPTAPGYWAFLDCVR